MNKQETLTKDEVSNSASKPFCASWDQYGGKGHGIHFCQPFKQEGKILLPLHFMEFLKSGQYF